jgi:hypothetical protein
MAGAFAQCGIVRTLRIAMGQGGSNFAGLHDMNGQRAEGSLPFSTARQRPVSHATDARFRGLNAGGVRRAMR